MKLEEAKLRIDMLSGKKFGQILSEEQLKDIILNKGKSGQVLETTIGLNLSNTDLDFEDGELKTNKCDIMGNPLETMFITQISSMIDSLLNSEDFYKSKLYKKIKNMLYVPINKIGTPENWMFLTCTHINLEDNKYVELRNQLEKDYYSICKQLNEHINSEDGDGYIHTSNGKFIQIRSKDSKPYSPIYSSLYKKEVSNKNHAFYFKKDFMKYIKNTFINCNIKLN